MRKLRNTQKTFSRFDTERREVIKAIRSVYYRHTSETSDDLQREQLCDHDPFFCARFAWAYITIRTLNI